MNATTTIPSNETAQRIPVLRDRAPLDPAARDFATLSKLGRKLPEGDARLAQQAAANLLTELFFHPVLSEMRKWPFGAKFATGGRVEEVFSEQLDKRVADAVALSDPGGITTSIARTLTSGADVQLRSLPAYRSPAANGMRQMPLTGGLLDQQV